MKFIVDLTMGRLAKWLRIAGYDTVFYNVTDVDKLIKIASKEGRMILTRNSGFIRKKKKILEEKSITYLLLTDDRVENQFKKVAADLKLNLKDNFFTRCIKCNKPLTNMPKVDVTGKVPEYVYQNHNEFVQCTNCKKIFWGGTHRDRMEKIIKSIFVD